LTQPDLALTESRTLRAQHMTRTEVLDKVGSLSLLADDVHATTDLVAAYFEVDAETIKKLVQRNRAELADNGMRVIKGDELRAMVRDNPSLTYASSLALFTRRAILNVGQLLTNSAIAVDVRRYLLNVEQNAPATARAVAVQEVADAPNPVIERAAVAQAHLAVIEAAKGTGVDLEWLTSKAYVAIARGLSEEPEVPTELHPLYVPDFLANKGLTKKEVTSEQSWFSKRVKALAEADGVEVPNPRYADLVSGQIRKTIAWKQKHLPYFERVWETHCAEKYATPMFLELGAA
jgi:hypothetical protein